MMHPRFEFVPTHLSRIAFCDGSALPVEDGHPQPLIRYAAWSAHDCSFEVQEAIAPSMSKRQMTRRAEMLAIEIAATFAPEVICCDAKWVVNDMGKSYQGIPLKWIQRKHNAIADYLTKSPVGKGYLVFNDNQVSRGWIDTIYEN